MNLTHSKLQTLGTPFSTPTPAGQVTRGTWHDIAVDLHRALLSGSDRAVLGIKELLTSKDELIPFYLHAVQPAMYEVGRLWEEGAITVVQEHQATSRLGRLIAALHAGFIRTDGETGLAVIAAVTGEFHEMGAWLVSDALELDGWETRFLGGNTTEECLMEMVGRYRPDIVALSVTLPSNIETARHLVATLRSDPGLCATPVLAGGQALNTDRGTWREIGADAYASNVEEARAMARQLLRRRRAEADTGESR